MRRVVLVILLGALVAVGLSGALAWWLPRLLRPQATLGPAPAPTPQPGATIRATLYYVSEDGLRLVGVARDVPFGQGVDGQARLLVEAQLAPAPEPFAQAIPQGTSLRDLYVLPNGDAFVDLSAEARSAHPGGSIAELFSVFAIVNAVTANLPAIKRVQILVDGREVDTLAGHVDLRHPLGRNLNWVTAP